MSRSNTWAVGFSGSPSAPKTLILRWKGVPEITNPETVLVASGMREPDLITRRRFRTSPSGEIWPTEGYQGVR